MPSSAPEAVSDAEAVNALGKALERALASRDLPALMDDPKAADRVVEQSDLVFYSPPSKEFADQVLPKPMKRQEIVFEFPGLALAAIRAALNVASASA